MMRLKFGWWLLAVSLMSCGDVPRENKPMERAKIASQKVEPSVDEGSLRLPEIPMCLNSDGERYAYLGEHYWDYLDLESTVLLDNRELWERTFVEFVFTIARLDNEVADGCVERLMHRVNADSLWAHRVIETARYYLYDVESPIMNEPMYVPFVQNVLLSPTLTDVERSRYGFELQVAMKNNPGALAGNFTYVNRENVRCTLLKSLERLTLLCFSDPECENCEITAGVLGTNKLLNHLIATRQLDVLMIYTEGSEEVWKEMKEKYPAQWKLGFDEEEKIKMEGIYELRAMPSLYLLDEQGKVILKDKKVEIVLGFLEDALANPME